MGVGEAGSAGAAGRAGRSERESERAGGRGGGGAGRGRAPRGEAPGVGEGACLVQAPTAGQAPPGHAHALARPAPARGHGPGAPSAPSARPGRSPRPKPAADLGVSSLVCIPIPEPSWACLGPQVWRLPGPPPRFLDFGHLAPDFVVLLHLAALRKPQDFGCRTFRTWAPLHPRPNRHFILAE